MGGVDADELLDLLRNIPASGVGSFENFVRDLLSRTTGRRVTVAKSGPQGGIDGRTGDDRHATVIGVETKRYGMETKLPLDEIKSKLRDAAATHADLDLWILVASREIKEPDRGSLQATGQDLGVEVLILDWPESPEVLPGLLVMCAAHPDIVESYALATPTVLGVLQAVRDHSSYPVQRAELESNLREPELGYANARQVMADRIRANMASMTAASARIGRYTNLADPNIVRIDRPVVRKAITDWWNGAAPRPTLALLGTEGMGKTWAALGWWLDRERADNPLPLTLIVPARSVSEATPDAVIGKALFAIFRTRDPTWWAKRAARWCAGASETRLILILDGLNERFEAQDWSILLAELSEPPWKDAVSVVLTDRQDHWRRIGSGIGSAGVPCAEQAIGHFSDAELDEILGRAGLSRAALDDRLVRLLKVPRLCTLALRHWEKLGRSGDITPERLIYEDFRDRIYPDLGDDEMRNLIASIGNDIRGSASPDITVLRRNVREALTAESGGVTSDAAISEIVSGIWFAPIPGEPNKLKVNPDLAPVAIGLALARAVQGDTTAPEIAARIEAFLDDLRGLELGITIVGIAASFATVWPLSTVVARDTLLDTWLVSDNFNDDELKRYARVIQEEPSFFLDRTERVWRDRQRVHDDRNVHLAGLVNAAEAYPTVLAAFVARATAWLSETFGWRDAMNGGDPPDEIGAAAVRTRVEAWNAVHADTPELVLIEPGADNDWVSVASSTLSAISYLPRAPFAAALGAYAVAMTLTRRVHYHVEQFEWLLRANTVDPHEAEPALISVARGIAAIPHPEAGAAADLLLESLSSFDPAAQPGPPGDTFRIGHSGTLDTGAGGITRWTPGVSQEGPHWGEQIFRNSRELVALAEDPSAELHPDSIAVIRAAFDHVVANDQDRDFDLRDSVRTILARWVPDLLAQYLRRTDTISSAGRGLSAILHGLEATWLVHDAATRHGIRSAYEASLLAANTAGTRMNVDLVVLALGEASVGEQYAAFQTMSGGPLWPQDATDFLKKPGADEFALYPALLEPNQDPKVITGWLGLLEYSDLTDMPPGFAPVAALFTHDSADVRAGASRVAAQAPDATLANMLRDTGWSATGREGEDAFRGSVALAKAEPVAGEDRPGRILTVTWGYLSREWPDQADYADAFARNVKRRVTRELVPAGETHGFGYAMHDRPSYVRLVAERREEAESWLQPALDGASISHGDMILSPERATIELMRALINAGSATGATVWRSLVKSMTNSNLKSDDVIVLPFDVEGNPVSDALRQEALAIANVDNTLFDIAAVLQRRGEADWLIAGISGLFGKTVFEHAKALVLAGELDNTPEAEALWTTVILPQPLPRWLAEVRDAALGRYRANGHAKVWLSRFCSSGDTIEAFAAFELFRLTAGRACPRWATSMIDAARTTMSERAQDHWSLNVPQLNRRLNEIDKPSKDRLAFDKVPKLEQAPWR
ncbi:hypothetical protein [Sphingomonas sp. TREG-RG-20F-R18-01]|uniref:hypothetical protein n=1 Tax=Sphingomonas sp. TREG-RG-20F-R18-01 TaxID=2914982 RepID=UPI001F55B537|nr:hypothetical protein [Sphingomonas sp. TREG-RG-20F-R18-01]